MIRYAFLMTCSLIVGALAVEYKHYFSHQIPIPVATLADGSVYDGELNNGRLSGKGRLVWPSDEYYEGEFSDGLFHGKGVLHTQTYFYEGDFEQGHASGEGLIRYENGDEYQGEVRFNLPHGKGELKKSDGAVYVGEFQTGQYHGQGKLLMVNGDRYEGGFKQGKFHGDGVYTQTDVNDKEEPMVQIYRGSFVAGRLTGLGRWEQNDSFYEGDFVDFAFEGKGLYRVGGTTYEGEFHQGRYEGKGVYANDDGERYEGDFLYGRYHGSGILTSSNGDVYNGEFAYGLPEGKGQLDYADALDGIASVKGEWKRGVLIEADDPRLAVSAETLAEYALYHQQDVLRTELATVVEHNPKEIDLYFVGIGGDGTQGVFRREVNMVKQWFDERYGTQGRSVNLINSRFAYDKYPLATITSIEQTLQSVANKMDKEDDILFVYLSSHGSSDFRFYLTQPGLSLESLDAQRLGEILKELPVRHKVIVISACYSGGFVEKIKDDYMMVITASSADKTSFGCSDRATMTYFGEAFFKDALFDETSPSVSFVTAFDRARDIVKGREAEKGLENSNPLIFKPKAILAKLQQWREQRQTKRLMVAEDESDQ